MKIGIYEYIDIKHLKEVETSKINRHSTIKRLFHFFFFYKSMKPETMCPYIFGNLSNASRDILNSKTDFKKTSKRKLKH